LGISSAYGHRSDDAKVRAWNEEAITALPERQELLVPEVGVLAIGQRDVVSEAAPVVELGSRKGAMAIAEVVAVSEVAAECPLM